MTWARFDDGYSSHRKIRRLSDAAFRLDVSAVCWACEQLTDGHILADELAIVSDVRNPEKAAAELVKRGRWDKTDDGWVIHDYLDYNPSKAEVLAQRERERDKKRRQRAAGSQAVSRGTDGRFQHESPKESPGDTPRDHQGDSPEDSQGVSSATRPVPSRSSIQDLVCRLQLSDASVTTTTLRDHAKRHAPRVNLEAEAEEFVTRNGPKWDELRDPSAAWRAWLRKAAEREQTANKPTLSGKQTMCGEHPEHPALNCPTCHAEIGDGTPPPNWRNAS